MAVSNTSISDNYDALLSTTLRNYRKKLGDNVFQDVPLLYWLDRKGKRKTITGGYSIIVPLIYGLNDTVGFYSGFDTIDTTPQEGITVANYEWAQMAVSISISGEEEMKNAGEHQLIDLLATKVMQAEKSMKQVINDHLHGLYGSYGKTFGDGVDVGSAVDSSGQSNVDITGFNSLDHIVRMPWGMVDVVTAGTARTHTVGGIQVSTNVTDGGGTAPADDEDWAGGGIVSGTNSWYMGAQTNSWWMNYSNPGFLKYKNREQVLGAPLSDTELDWAGTISGSTNQNLIAAMRAMYNRISEGSDHPDLGLAGQDVYDSYEGALMPLERFTDTKSGDAGFMNLRFKNMTLMYDHGIRTAIPGAIDVSAGTYATPMYFLNSEYLEWTVNTRRNFVNTKFYRPHNQDAKTAQILLGAQLCCSNRQRQGVIAFGNDATNYTP